MIRSGEDDPVDYPGPPPPSIPSLVDSTSQMEGVDKVREIVDEVQTGNPAISGVHWDSKIKKLVIEFSPNSSSPDQDSAKAELRKGLGTKWERVTFEVSNVSTAEGQRLAEAIWGQSVKEGGLPRNHTAEDLNNRAIVGSFYDYEREAVIVISGKEGGDEEIKRILSRVPNPSNIKIIESPGEMQAHARTCDGGGSQLSGGSK